MAFHIFTQIINITNLTQPDYVLSSSISVDNVIKPATNESSLELTRFIIQKICVPIVTLTGVVGNSLSMVVLTRKCMKSSTNSYLTALAMFDILYLIFSFVLSLKHHRLFIHSFFYIHCFPIVRVLTDMFANVSVVLTVTFTVERYIGVCHPMKGRILCTSQRAKLITVAVSAVGMVCTAPEFWEMEVIYHNVDNQTIPRAVYTEFAQQPSYEVGYSWFLVVTFTLLPLVLLCVFNGILILAVIRAAKLRREMTLLSPVSDASNNKRSGHSQPKEQLKITKMLITVVLAFIACQLPGALLLLIQTYHSLSGAPVSGNESFLNIYATYFRREEQNNLKIAANLTNLLIQVNASINFILYSAISTKFRRVFFRIVWRKGTWLNFMQDRRQTNFSKSDGLQMSSFYVSGDRVGSKTSCSTYTYKGTVFNRSPRTETTQTSEGDTIHRKQLNRHIGPDGLQTTNQSGLNEAVCLKCARRTSWLSTIAERDQARSCNLCEKCGNNGVCVDEGGSCRLASASGGSRNSLSVNWRASNGHAYTRTTDNVNR